MSYHHRDSSGQEEDEDDGCRNCNTLQAQLRKACGKLSLCDMRVASCTIAAQHALTQATAAAHTQSLASSLWQKTKSWAQSWLLLTTRLQL